MKTNFTLFVITLLLPLSMFLQGCSFSAKKDPTRFYLLRPEPDVCLGISSESNIQKNWTLGVMRVRLPKYLDTAKFSYIKCPNQIVYAEYNRWSEPLDAGIQRVLGQDLSHRVPCTVVASQPWPNGIKPDLEIYLVFNDLLADRHNNTFIVDANWTITGPGHDKVHQQGHVCYRTCLPGAYEPRCVVDLYNDAVARISESVTGGLNAIAKDPSVLSQPSAKTTEKIEKITEKKTESVEHRIEVDGKSAIQKTEIKSEMIETKVDTPQNNKGNSKN